MIQEHLEEGWGESCIDSLTIVSDGPIMVKDMITTESEIEEIQKWHKDENDKNYPHAKMKALKTLHSSKVLSKILKG